MKRNYLLLIKSAALNIKSMLNINSGPLPNYRTKYNGGTGTTKLGSNGVVINEIMEVTGTTDPTIARVSFALPSGYNMANTRVLSLAINYNSDRWI
jgi:hypothetical protein